MFNRREFATMTLTVGVALCAVGAWHLAAAESAPAAKSAAKSDAANAKKAAKAKKAAEPEAPVFLTPEKAGPDFAIQGEYEGPCGSGKLGAQIIALDRGEFHAVFLRGGLPGAGWDSSAKVEVDGKRDGDKAGFTGAWQATIANGALAGKTDTGESFTLKRVVRHSPTEGAKPSAGALVLFDGTSVDAWDQGRLDDRKLLCAGATSKQTFKNFTLHLEFLLPFKPGARGQARGNSGVYLQNRYEVQVLDSFGLAGLDNECGGIYKQAAPKVNICFPPLQWQTYDIDFQAARLDESGKIIKDAAVAVKHNGVAIHEGVELKAPTSRRGAKDGPPDQGPINLQFHANPVFYRNLWLVEKK